MIPEFTPLYTPPSPHRWPEGAIVYQVYPRSLQDSNGDGVGDLPGVIQRLDYFKNLGINALWLSPFYPSPMADFGYDISDYCDVDPVFGTMDDFKRLLAQAHARDLKVIIDLVPNHTSDEHVWFKESRRSLDNPKSDWYIWKDPHPNSAQDIPLPPNNWQDALTGGSAWKWDEGRRQFYLHSFDVKQPDLNWANAEVRQAMRAVMRFWLDVGVDGFRVDAVYWMSKDPMFRDDPPNPEYDSGEDPRYDMLLHENSCGWPSLYAYLSEMANVLQEPQYAEKHHFMVTEAYPERHNPIGDYMAFYKSMDPKFAAPFNFEGLILPWEATPWRRFLRQFHQALAEQSEYSVASYAFSNHDQSRMLSRMGETAARSAAVMQLTLPGMIFVYYGEEIGMRNGIIPAEFVQDPGAKNDPVAGIGRDPERTPMQWAPSRNAGFSSADHTWLPVNVDYVHHNVDSESADPTSTLSLYRALCRLRHTSKALRHGTIEILDAGSPDVLAYTRHYEDEHYLVLINFSANPVTCSPGVAVRKRLISSNPLAQAGDVVDSEIELLPNEGALFLQ